MTMNDLPAAGRFLETALGNGPGRVLCAVSGGLDSMCLLQFVTQWGRERDLSVTAAHFNHHLRGAESQRDEDFVRDWCAARGIPAVFGGGDVRAHAAETDKTIEEAARDLHLGVTDQLLELHIGDGLPIHEDLLDDLVEHLPLYAGFVAHAGCVIHDHRRQHHRDGEAG